MNTMTEHVTQTEAADMIAVERDAWKARAETAERQLAEARGLLRPFAGAAARYDENDTCDRVPDDEPVVGYGVDLTVTVGHFRRAALAIGDTAPTASRALGGGE